MYFTILIHQLSDTYPVLVDAHFLDEKFGKRLEWEYGRL